MKRDKKACGNFTGLTPDVIVTEVEQALGRKLLGYTHPLNSYINRVYEVMTADGERVIVKFYRPGRWSKEAIQDEHDFVIECEKDEIPVVAPFVLQSNTTVGDADGVFFAVYPKRMGRIWEQTCDDDWKRLGRVVARAHVVGSRRTAKYRLHLHPCETTEADIGQLLDGGHIPPRYSRYFEDIASSLLDLIIPLFDGREHIRIHGDCHSKNILHRPGEGLLLIDFDDMVTGPPIHDLWMLLPGRASDSGHELELMLKGYREFRDFDEDSIELIEPLRGMRMLYFLDWISRQREDPSFTTNFPQWCNDSFWAEQNRELSQQLNNIKATI